MEGNIITATIEYIKESAPSFFLKLLLWVLLFTIIYLIIKKVISNVKSKIESNNIVADVYAKKNAKLVWWVLFIILMIFNILATFQIIWFDVAIIMWWISLSLWFAMETTIWNMISWIFILTNKKIRLWDFVQFMGPLNMMWTIEEINVRYTVIRTFDKRRTVVPNSLIAKTPIRTLKTEPLLRWEVIFRVPRHVLFPQIKQIFTTIINSNKNILYPEYTTILIDNFDNVGINIKWFFFASPAKKSPSLVARDLKLELFKELKKYWIKPSYSHLTITTE